jgi:DNA-binding NarL/FixJ family response regulator
MAQSRRPPRTLRPAFPVRANESDFRAAAFTAGETTFVVMSLPSPEDAGPVLTSAEREVRAALLRGETNAQIAAARHTSVRTVANQVASLMRKLSVGSRAELAALALSTPDDAPPSE